MSRWYSCGMFVRCKKNKSGSVSVQIIFQQHVLAGPDHRNVVVAPIATTLELYNSR